MQNPSSEATGGAADMSAAGFGYSLLPPCIFPVVTGGPASAWGLPAGFLGHDQWSGSQGFRRRKTFVPRVCPLRSPQTLHVGHRCCPYIQSLSPDIPLPRPVGPTSMLSWQPAARYPGKPHGEAELSRDGDRNGIRTQRAT